MLCLWQVFLQCKAGVAGVADEVAAGAIGNFAACDLGLDVIFGRIVALRSLRIIQHLEQFRLVFVQTLQQDE